MKVLVSGAGGYLGRHVVDRLLVANHEVRAIVRPMSAAPARNGKVEIFRADLREHDLAKAFEGIDAVVHAAAATSGSEDSQFASTVVATERFLDAMAKSPVKRLVHISSLVVYDWSRARHVMDETTPLHTGFYDMGGYTIAKSWQERLVTRRAAAISWDLTIMRPGFIWGPDRALIAGMGRHFSGGYVMFGPFTRLPLTHVVNCADSIVRAVENPAAVGKSFNVVDDDNVRVWRYVHEYAKGTRECGVPLPIPYLIGFGIAKLAALTSRILFGSSGKLPSLLTPRRFEAQFKPLRFSNRKLKDVLGWRPPLSFAECVRVTYGAPTHAAVTSDHEGIGA
jgi:UDP-glucose 4-epimerase